MKNRSEKEAERVQILTISPGNSRPIAQESGEIRGGLGPWTAQPLLQPISFKSDRLLGTTRREGKIVMQHLLISTEQFLLSNARLRRNRNKSELP